MRQINIFSDRRFDLSCSYCGSSLKEQTRDHVPSKILLDKPFPENLPVILACYSCNQNFSMDEEYFACLIECAKLGTTEIENLQRENLNPIEEAFAMSNLTKEFDWTHQEVADAIGKARATVSNLLRLLELPAEVRELIKNGQLTMGHARALLTLSKDQQLQASQAIVAKNLSVRQTEQLVRSLLSGKSSSKETINAKKDPTLQNLENKIADILGASVKIKQGANAKKGRIEIQYNNLDELDGILGKIGASE